MKQALLCFALCLFLSCTKEDLSPEKLSGTWTIVESHIGIDGGGVEIHNYQPSSEITLQFETDGKVTLTGANPGNAMSPLWKYERYEMLPRNMIRFYTPNSREEMQAHYTINGELYLNYPWARCGHEERFLRIR